jgi:hypothetical protein
MLGDLSGHPCATTPGGKSDGTAPVHVDTLNRKHVRHHCLTEQRVPQRDQVVGVSRPDQPQ